MADHCVAALSLLHVTASAAVGVVACAEAPVNTPWLSDGKDVGLGKASEAVLYVGVLHVPLYVRQRLSEEYVKKLHALSELHLAAHAALPAAVVQGDALAYVVDVPGAVSVNVVGAFRYMVA